MRRRWLVTLELLLLLAILAWAGYAFARPVARPDGAIDLKVQLRGASDRAFLLRDADGALRYEIQPEASSPIRLSPDEFAQRLFAEQSSRGALESLLNVSSPVGFLWVSLEIGRAHV